MKNFKKKDGITLIALVVTIVVLLILAGVSISLVIGQNGLISKAKEAKEKTEQATANEQASMSELYDELTGYLGELPSTNETKPYLPTGFNKVAGTNLDTGLVIQDGSGNQYVWVEVLMNETVYPTAGLEVTNFTDQEYTAIENDLHTYTSTYRNGTGYTDTYYPDTDNTGWFANETEYNTAKQKMLKSVYQNGRFYVGRYETGIAYDDANGSRSFGSDTSTVHEAKQTPVIKANAYPYNWVRRTQAKVLAESMYSGDRTSSLMFGVQWDLILKYLETKEVATQDELKTDSRDIGNYSNATFNVTNTSAKYSTDNGTTWSLVTTEGYKKPSYPVLLTTGANEKRNSQMNICDLAGNVWDFTLENTSYTNQPCAPRGGIYDNNGSACTASYRGNSYVDRSYHNVGFRVSLY